jgi:hypothetical protein
MHLKGSPLQNFTMQQNKNKETKQQNRNKKQAGGYEIPDPLTRLVFHQPFAVIPQGLFYFFVSVIDVIYWDSYQFTS